MFDVLTAIVGLLLLAPVLGGIALAIALTDGLPVFFRQSRVGRNGKPFQLLKFRSMRSSTTGPHITGAGDARITRLGAFLRHYKLDELPQLWNVLRGDMRLVGPRPEVPRFVDMTDPTWQAVLSVKPGITDLASLLYRHEEELLAEVNNVEDHYRNTILPAKLALNLEYLSVRTFWSDLKLICLTAWYSAVPKMFDQWRIRRVLLSREAGQ